MKAENDPTSQIEQFKLKIKERAFVHQNLLEYFGIFAGGQNHQKTKIEINSEKLFKALQERHTLANKCDFREILVAISYLLKAYQPKREIKHKIENLLIILKKDIKNIFSEKELFEIFHYSRSNFILLILVEQNILSVETIINSINLKDLDDWVIIRYFYPEIREYNKDYFYQLMNTSPDRYDQEYGEKCELKRFYEENDKNLGFFYEIRKDVEKEPKIIELIRENKIEEFILFVECSPIDLNEKIQNEKTIFEADPEIHSPIEFAALFGSISIFKYLYMKGANIKIIDQYGINSIIEYAIQGRNYEIIHLLEERKEIIEELNNQEHQKKYLKSSLKMYYNEIFEYLISNYNFKLTKKVIKSIIIYRNYQLLDQLIERNQIEFKNKAIMTNIFKGFGDDEDIVEILINHPNLNINTKRKIFDDFLEMNKMKKKTRIIKRIFIVIDQNRN